MQNLKSLKGESFLFTAILEGIQIGSQKAHIKVLYFREKKSIDLGRIQIELAHNNIAVITFFFITWDINSRCT